MYDRPCDESDIVTVHPPTEDIRASLMPKKHQNSCRRQILLCRFVLFVFVRVVVPFQITSTLAALFLDTGLEMP